MSKETEDKIDKAAESYMNSVHSTEYKDREYSYRAFKIGAKSPEAKEHWQEGMYTEEQVKELLKNIIYDYHNWQHLEYKWDLSKWFGQNKKKL